MASKDIIVGYYAVLREQRGCNEESVTTQCTTTSELYAQLKAEHGFHLEESQLKVVVNEDFSTWDYALQEDDHIVFIPPVAGG